MLLLPQVNLFTAVVPKGSEELVENLLESMGVSCGILAYMCVHLSSLQIDRYIHGVTYILV